MEIADGWATMTNLRNFVRAHCKRNFFGAKIAKQVKYLGWGGTRNFPPKKCPK
jgi:hypothetical protein